MLKIKLDKTKLSVSDNLVQIKTFADAENITKECITDPNDSKFGEIFLSLEGRIYYNCTFCDANFYCFKAFSKHFVDIHAIDWTDLIYSDGNYACCSKVEPDYTACSEKYEIIDDSVIVEEQSEQMEKEDTESVEEVNNEHSIENSQVHIKNSNDANSSIYIVQQYEPDEIIYANNLVKIEKSSLVYSDEQSESIEPVPQYVQMVVKNEGTSVEEVYAENDFAQSTTEQVFENVESADIEDLIELPKDIDVTCYPLPKCFLSTIRQLITNRCKFCNEKTDNLDFHYKQYIGKFVCNFPECSEPFDNINELNNHNEEMHSDSESLFRCFYCDFKDNLKENLVLHYRKVHLMEKNFRCLKCGEEFFSQDELLNHDEDTHLVFEEYHVEPKDLEYQDSMDIPTNDNLDDENGNENIKKIFGNPETESDTSSEADEDSTEKKKKGHHVEVDDPLHPYFISLMKQFHTKRCKICKVKSSLLSTHYRKIHFEKFTCDVNQCSEPFDTEEELAAHTAELHVDPYNPFKCAYCDYKATEKRRLSYHYRRNHLVEKKYQCHYCPMKFFYEKERVQHHRVHTGEHPFSCDICGQAFKTAVIMRMHKKRKHEPPSESCEVCGKMFSTKENLKNHSKTHLSSIRTICHICGASFSRTQCLKNHLFVHSNEVFKCDLCQRTFTRQTRLKEHLKLHQKYESENIPMKKYKPKTSKKTANEVVR